MKKFGLISLTFLLFTIDAFPQKSYIANVYGYKEVFMSREGKRSERDLTTNTHKILTNLSAKEISLISKESIVVNWFTIISPNHDLTDKSKYRTTFNCKDRSGVDCTVSISHHPNNLVSYHIVYRTVGEKEFLMLVYYTTLE